MTGHIYRIINNITNTSYIGQTTYTVKMRWNIHKSPKSSCKFLRNAILKYGVDNFTIVTLETVEALDKNILIDRLNELEVYYMDKFNTMTPNGYNIMPGGRNAYRGKSKKPRGGWKQTEEAKRKISLANMGKKKGPKTPESVIRGAESHEKPIKCNETGQEWASIKKCSESFNTKPESIHRVLRGNRKHFRNLTFSYIGKPPIKFSEETRKKLSEIGKNQPKIEPKPLAKEQIDRNRKPIICNETGYRFESLTEACSALNLSISKVCCVLKGKRKTHKGLTFSYI